MVADSASLDHRFGEVGHHFTGEECHRAHHFVVRHSAEIKIANKIVEALGL